MYSFLIAADYRKQIQEATLQQIISNDRTILESAQLAAEGEAKSYLRQKYDVTTELAATTPWLFTQVYNADDTIYLTGPAYLNTALYVLNQLVSFNNFVYINTTAITVPEEFNATKWAKLGCLNQIIFGKLPNPQFNYLTIYKLGDVVFWKNNTYTCAQATAVLTPGIQFQEGFISNVPAANVFPDDPTNGVAFWGNPTPYSIAANTLPTNATYWTVGDNRDQQMVLYFIDITLYHVHSRIAPRNIPEIREKRYHAAIDWLVMCARGGVTPELPVLQPRQGGRIRYGGQAKAQNFY